MARPAVSAAAETLYASLPWMATKDDETYGWALLHFCESIAKTLQKANDLAYDSATGDPGWSVVMSADTAPADWLAWLGQLVGVKVDTYQSAANQRQQIKDEQGQKRGTLGFLRSAIKRYLQGTQHIDITERDTSPYHLAVRVYRGELAGLHYDSLDSMYLTYNALDAAYVTYDDITSTSDQQLLDAAQAAKPAGLIMATTITPGLP